MPDEAIDLNSLLSENPVAPKAEETQPQDQPETAATSSSDEPPEQDEEKAIDAGPVTLKALAKEAGIDLKDLYAATDSNGKTLSEIADGAKDMGSLQTDRETFESERVSFRTEKAQTIEQLQALTTAITSGQSPEQAQEALKQFNSTELEREQRMLLSVVPEWRDPAQKQADVETMVAYAGQFGVTADDLGQIRDHRYLAMLRHNAKQAHRLKDILDGAEKPKPKGVKAGKAKPSKAGGQAVDLASMLKEPM
jgi:hypothetical protein